MAAVHEGNLPLHIACKNSASLVLVLWLVNRYPKSVSHTNEDGKLPVELVQDNFKNKDVVGFLNLKGILVDQEAEVWVQYDKLQLVLKKVCKTIRGGLNMAELAEVKERLSSATNLLALNEEDESSGSKRGAKDARLE